MKNQELWSRSVDRKILAVVCSLCALTLASGTGFAYPVPRGFETVAPVNALITGLLLVLVWAAFRVLRPSRPNPTWEVAEGFGIPLVWMLLVALFLLWVHTACDFGFDFDALKNALVRLIV